MDIEGDSSFRNKDEEIINHIFIDGEWHPTFGQPLTAIVLILII